MQTTNAVNVLATLLLTMIAIPFIWTVGPIIETAYAPVTSKLTIIAHREVKDGTVIQFEYSKTRPCEFIPSKFEWYQGHERRAGVLLYKWEDDKISSNPTGKYVSDPWFVGLTWGEIQYNSTAYWSHKCHPLWDSVTRIWPVKDIYAN